MAENVIKLKVDSTEYEGKIKRATQGLTAYADSCRKVGSTLEVVEKETLDFVKQLGRMDTVSRDARGKINELTKAFTDLSSQYRAMTEAEKQSPYGKALSNSLDQLRQRIVDARTEMNGINRELSSSKFGNFGSVVDTLGNKLGVTGNLTEMLTSKTALLTAGMGAAAAIVGKATQEWVKYNSELSKQDQVTTVTTGLTGSDADRMTDNMRALSDTYGVDFREAINAANTLMTQFGVTGNEATQLIKDGMQGMIQGDGPKLLQMIQQFAPSFRDAGISASQLVAIIHNSEGGIFTDQNMNAIVMGIKNIRLMTTATSDALAKVGIDGEEMTRKLDSGAMTIFDALKTVSRAIGDVGSGSQAAGEVMQNVFGRQGVVAGTNLGKAIETLNTNLEETKRQTGELGEAYADLQVANEKLNTAIRDCFEYDGWDEMATGIESNLVTALASVVEKLATIKSLITDNSVWETYKKGIQGVLEGILNTLPALSTFVNLLGLLGSGDGKNKPILGSAIGNIANNKGTVPNKGTVDVTLDPDIIKPHKPKGGGGNNTPPPIAGSIDWQTKKVQDLQKAWRAAADDDSRKKIAEQIKEAQAELDKMQGKELPAGSVAALNQEMAKLKKEQEQVTSHEGWVELQRKINNLKFTISDLKGGMTQGVSISDSISNGITNREKELKTGKIDFSKSKLPNAKDFVNQGKEAEKSWNLAAQAVANVGNAFAGIEDPGFKAAGTVIQAIASIALGFAQSSVMAASLGPYAWIAHLAAGAAAMATTISTIHSLTGYSEGGQIKGTTYSGDLIRANGGTIGLNAGEVVLNQAQTGIVASALQGATAGWSLDTELRGEDLRIMLVRNWQRRGRASRIAIG